MNGGWLGTVIAVLATFVVVTGFGVALGDALEPFSNRLGATPFDVRVTRWFVNHRSDSLTTVMRAITTLGSTVAIVALTTIAITVLVMRGHVSTAVFLAVTAVGASILSALVKAIVNRERPPQSFHLVHVASSAFPSGHATRPPRRTRRSGWSRPCASTSAAPE
jgi:undecaprenyl-diphosphatase